MITKAIIDFYHHRQTDLSPVAHAIHTGMSTHAAVFPTPPVTMAALLLQCTDYDEKLAAKASRSMADTLAFKVARATLEDTLRLLGSYVNNTAKGDAVIVMQSGFPSYTPRYSANHNPPPAPVNVRLSLGPVSGAFLLRFKAGRTPSMNEVEVNGVDPLEEAEWKSCGTYHGGRVMPTGLTPGALLWVRIRTLGLRNNPGDWSAAVQIRVV